MRTLVDEYGDTGVLQDVGAMKLARERASDELTGTQAGAALATALETLTIPTEPNAAIRGVRIEECPAIERQGRWLVVTLSVQHSRYRSIRLRLGERAGQELLERLDAALAAPRFGRRGQV